MKYLYPVPGSGKSKSRRNMFAPLTPAQNLDRVALTVAALLPRLASERDAEALEGVRAIQRVLRDAGVDIRDLARAIASAAKTTEPRYDP